MVLKLYAWNYFDFPTGLPWLKETNSDDYAIGFSSLTLVLFFILALFFPTRALLQLSHFVVDLLNQTLKGGKALKQLKDSIMEARWRVRMAEAASPKEVLSTVEANLAKARADLALKKGKGS